MLEREAAILERLVQVARPMSAYDLLHSLRPTHPRLGIPTVYRALARLAAKGMIWRIASLKAWIAKGDFSDEEVPVITICSVCGHVELLSAPDTIDAVSTTAAARGFQPCQPVVEVYGQCGACDARS